MCDYYMNGQFYIFRKTIITGLELNSMDVIYEKYKEDPFFYLISSALIGSKNDKLSFHFFIQHLKFRKVPSKHFIISELFPMLNNLFSIMRKNGQ